MENKNNNYVKEALDKIERRKVLLNNKTTATDDYINKLNNFILYNNFTINSIFKYDMSFYKTDTITNIILIASVILLDIVTSNGTDPNTVFMIMGMDETVRLINYNYFSTKFVSSFKDLAKEILGLKKLNRIAYNQISNKNIELEKYRKECESKAHKIISDIFSEDNMYYDENVISEEIAKFK